MDEIHYLISGDLHLDKYQYGLTIRHKDNLRCVEALVAEALGNPQTRGIILTGDTFNKRSILPIHQIYVRTVFQRLRAADKELLAIDGNHDLSEASWLDTVDESINQNGKTRLLGAQKAVFFSFQPREQLYAVLRGHTGAKLVFLHGKLLELMSWVKAEAKEGANHEFSAVDLREMGFKDTTFFLGDIHTYGDFYDPVANNWFIYSGSTEMTEISEGNVISHRYGDHYWTQKKYLVLYPDRAPGENWELKDLPNRPYWKRSVSEKEEISAVIAQIDQWANEHPQGILALEYPHKFAPELQKPITQWRTQLLLVFDSIRYPSITRQLQELREIDILEIAKEELTPAQIQMLTVVVTEDDFLTPLKALVAL